ncbi:hypothetical protein BSI_11910 [Bacillus inaquosorum KCTC 13429]|uniref:Uncharacterized protein n=1 Tax=Bacillus inaquosorum KCTC 13429 TaxID=1236548 RepID=A0A9W5LK13_9BACI|nr:hypothetical protein BSI_11910 [Bacillus inaquosorum KCTC 13429]
MFCLFFLGVNEIEVTYKLRERNGRKLQKQKAADEEPAANTGASKHS